MWTIHQYNRQHFTEGYKVCYIFGEHISKKTVNMTSNKLIGIINYNILYKCHNCDGNYWSTLDK